MPILNGKTIEEEEFEKLDEKTRKQFEENSIKVQEQIIEAINQIKVLEKENIKKIEEWQSNIALITINSHVNPLKAKYKKNIKIAHFFDCIKSDVLKNLSLFVKDEVPETKAQTLKQEIVKPWLNYRVNLFVDNSNLTGSPVIMDSNYLYHNLFGKLEYENQYGMLKTDFTMLKPGLLHKANGGYIILQASDLLANPICYDALKKALLVKELNIENNMEQRSYMVMISLKPEPIPLNVKVLLLGDSNMGEISTVDFFPFAWIIHLARALVFYNIVTAMTKRKLSSFWHFMVIVAPSMLYSYITLQLNDKGQKVEYLCLILYFVLQFIIVNFATEGKLFSKITAIVFSFLTMTMSSIIYFSTLNYIFGYDYTNAYSNSLDLFTLIAVSLFMVILSFAVVVLVKIVQKKFHKDLNHNIKYVYLYAFPLTHFF